jgi:hypothetical protein
MFMSSWLCQNNGLPNPVHPQHHPLLKQHHHTIDQFWSKDPNFCSSGFHKANRCGTKDDIATRCGMSITVLRTYPISYNACCAQHSCLRPDEVHRGNIGSHFLVMELLHHTSILKNTIPCIGYDSAHQQRCILHFQSWGMRPHRRPLLYGATRRVDAAHQSSYPLSRPLTSVFVRVLPFKDQGINEGCYPIFSHVLSFSGHHFTKRKQYYVVNSRIIVESAAGKNTY